MPAFDEQETCSKLFGFHYAIIMGENVKEDAPSAVTADIVLRDVIDDDLPIFFEQELDPDAAYMAAFTAKDPSDRAAFATHWARIRADSTVTVRTILCNGAVAGNVASYEQDGKTEVSYWLGKPYWGKGIATAALAAFLALLPARPLYAHVAKDNSASMRVLQKCGFTIIGESTWFANARGAEIGEYALELSESAPARCSGLV